RSPGRATRQPDPFNMSSTSNHGRLFTFLLFNHTTTTAISTLSLHDALPISAGDLGHDAPAPALADEADLEPALGALLGRRSVAGDRKSTRLNSSHVASSYAVFCLEKKTAYIRE